MSRHALDAKHYISSETLDLERKNLFGRLWIFVGFSSMVREKHQFFTRKVAGRPLLVQRTEAGIRAFLNQCPHRLSSLKTEPCGKGPLICPYHAWSFGAEGELRGLPNAGLYNFTAAEREGISLHKLHLEEVGQLLFVNFSKDPLALEEQFSSEFLDKLREVSRHFDTQIIYSCHRARYNWKLNMENVKDYNHVPFVHPKTFMPLMNSSPKAEPSNDDTGVEKSSLIALLETKDIPSLSLLSYSTVAPIKPYKTWFTDKCHAYRKGEHAYYNWFIYPNVNFGSVSGEQFHIQQFDPVSPGETDYHLWVMTAKRADLRTELTALLSTLMRGERAVIKEDTVVLERLQEGLIEDSVPFMHGNYEDMLVQQHLWYRCNVLEGEQ